MRMKWDNKISWMTVLLSHCDNWHFFSSFHPLFLPAIFQEPRGSSLGVLNEYSFRSVDLWGSVMGSKGCRERLCMGRSSYAAWSQIAQDSGPNLQKGEGSRPCQPRVGQRPRVEARETLGPWEIGPGGGLPAVSWAPTHWGSHGLNYIRKLLWNWGINSLPYT